jgi:hypothetical protein
MVKSHLRGHKIEHNGSEWIYSDTKQPTISTHKSRPCGKCSEYETIEGHDACLGALPGLMNACCGHGSNGVYIQFLDGVCIRGKDAEIIINVLKKYKT